MSNATPRPITPLDLPLVHRLAADRLPLDMCMALTRGLPGLEEALLSSVPIPDPTIEKSRAHKVIEGEIPSPINPPPGCVFHPRCPRATTLCHQHEPDLKPMEDDQLAACHHPID